MSVVGTGLRSKRLFQFLLKQQTGNQEETPEGDSEVLPQQIYKLYQLSSQHIPPRGDDWRERRLILMGILFERTPAQGEGLLFEALSPRGERSPEECSQEALRRSEALRRFKVLCALVAAVPPALRLLRSPAVGTSAWLSPGARSKAIDWLIELPGQLSDLVDRPHDFVVLRHCAADFLEQLAPCSRTAQATQFGLLEADPGALTLRAIQFLCQRRRDQELRARLRPLLVDPRHDIGPDDVDGLINWVGLEQAETYSPPDLRRMVRRYRRWIPVVQYLADPGVREAYPAELHRSFEGLLARLARVVHDEWTSGHPGLYAPEDAVQETWCRLLGKSETLRGYSFRGDFQRWFVNIALDLLRKRYRARGPRLDGRGVTLELGERELMSSESRGPQQTLEAQDLWAATCSKFPRIRETFEPQNRDRLDIIFGALMDYARSDDVQLPSAEDLVARIESATGVQVTRQNVRNLLHRLRSKLQILMDRELACYPTDGFRSGPDSEEAAKKLTAKA